MTPNLKSMSQSRGHVRRSLAVVCMLVSFVSTAWVTLTFAMPASRQSLETVSTTVQRPVNVRSCGLVYGTWSNSGSTREQIIRGSGLSPPVGSMSGPSQTKRGDIDVGLLVYFFFWFLGNYYYNITNKLACRASGGAAGFPMTIATLQLGVGCIFGLFLWFYPDARERPKITFNDWKATLPVGFTAAGAHVGSVFALSAGAVSFAQIVKAAEPAFAALVGSLFYRVSVSRAKWLALIPVIGGVTIASVSELDFTWLALFTAGAANVFAAFKANENKRLMQTEGFKERVGSVGNQFIITMLNSFFFCLPLMMILEGRKFGTFVQLALTNKLLMTNLLLSGLWFFAYNELATMTIKKTSAVTQSVANTAKRVIVIVGVAIVLRESLDKMKLAGCAIGIGGVFLYSIIDKIFQPAKPATSHPPLRLAGI